MNIKKLSKDELETMSYNDIAYYLLQEKTGQTTPSLFKKICTLLKMTDKDYENKIGGFYTSLTTDKRFILLDSGKWDLKENHSVKALKIDAILDDLEDIEIEETYDEEDLPEEENYDDVEEDDDDQTDDYKNLVIVDEDDLDNEQ